MGSCSDTALIIQTSVIIHMDTQFDAHKTHISMTLDERQTFAIKTLENINKKYYQPIMGIYKKTKQNLKE